ncbi:TIGR03621 family F420-dependent LLM class oxidoreductase [Fodinicola acaciae]|uniref:TIGR03621 family F420-dependent LLM class oxidoreductase n=1 Tax=Fodinicola acaciae TaxID=2681555 RepID=UPI001FEB0C13|nr:TIGR03621 family F420-dependent LLM class oxidoreductase [Fodinicola acaciae]
MTRSLRFSVNLLAACGRQEWVRKARTAESAGYDLIMVPDHLGMPAPFTSLLLAAEVTERPRIAPFVLNVGFYNPTLLAREVAGLDQYTGGRLDLGLGTGYVQAEFEAAGIAFGTPKERVDRLEHTIRELDRLLADPEHQPQPLQTPRPPLLIAGVGNRILRLAAENAAIVGHPGMSGTGVLAAGDTAKLAERVAYAQNAAGGRDVEHNLLLQQVKITDDARSAVQAFKPYAPDFTDEKLIDDAPIVQVGTAKEIAERLRRIADEAGVTHFTVLEENLTDFAAVIEELR